MEIKKSILFAQYWGQKVFNYQYGIQNDVVNQWTINSSGYVLELYEPNSITDDHAEIIAVQNKFKGESVEAKIKVGRDIINRVLCTDQNLMCLPMESADFLRSKGYALPFNGWSIEDQVYSGFVRLITRTEEEKTK